MNVASTWFYVHVSHSSRRDPLSGTLQKMSSPGRTAVQFKSFIETTNTNTSLCRGDSGSPLFQMNKRKQYVQIGIASSVEQKCTFDTNGAIDSWMCVTTLTGFAR
ncbi:hypothetical protein RB195_003030 [Necator americanus]|uniref:Peptidase S1 domain-containing protein n=1 Tax=Necator americanus TaxID=51031 RepID=A0ABR1DN30_NECAM